MTGSPERVPAGRPPLINVVAANGRARVLASAVAVAWYEKRRAEGDHVWIHRDGAAVCAGSRSGRPVEAVRRDEHPQPPGFELLRRNRQLQEGQGEREDRAP